jgi:acetyltransferase-like isoleucine patch superfamily enzyme
MKIRLFFFRLLNGSKFGQYKGHVYRPLKLQGHAYIHIETGAFVHDLTWLGAYKIGGKDPELRLKEGVCVGHFNHFSCAEKIILEKNVLTADKVFITDNTHAFEDIHQPVNFQPIKVLRPVVIGEGAWIGENVSILGCSVGKNSIVGANSVVTKDIPDYCVAVGNPARVIKRYDLEKMDWISVEEVK